MRMMAKSYIGRHRMTEKVVKAVLLLFTFNSDTEDEDLNAFDENDDNAEL